MKHPTLMSRVKLLFPSGRSGGRLGLLCILLAVSSSPAATILWNGASGAGTNWSTGANWSGSVAPAGGDDVKFFDAGTNGVNGLPNSFADLTFAGYVGSLQFGQTNGLHTVAIESGQTLNVTNGNFIVGTPGDVGVAKNFTNTITGTGATLNISNASAVIALNQGSATSVTLTRANLDLSALDTFTANVRRLGIGSTMFPNPGTANQREAGALILAKTNYITLTMTDTLASYQIAGRTNALEMSRNPGNNAGILSLLYLGQTNVIYADSFGFGRDKASAGSAAVMIFNPAFTNGNPVAYIRGASGGSSRVTWWALGDMNANASSAQSAVGTNDFSNGTVDAMIDTISLSRDCSPQHTATGVNNIGVLTFNAGTINANTIFVGNQVLGPASSFAGNIGILNVNGTGSAGAKLVVNTVLDLGHTTSAYAPGVGGTNALKTTGTLNIRNGGVVLANSIVVGANSTNNIVTLTNGTLILTNTLGTPARGPVLLATTNSTFQLNVTGLTNIVCTNLVTGGATNIINPATVAVFAAYPAQVVLIKYSAASIGGAGFNFGFGANTLPPTAPGAYLSNNIANKSVDLVLPLDPRPVITNFAGQPVSSPLYPSPNDDVSISIGISPATVLPVGYQWYFNSVAITNGPTGNGSTNAGSDTATLAVLNSQTNDSGNYTVVITNIYGAATSSVLSLIVSTNPVAPAIIGLGNLTVIQNNSISFVTTVSGKPAPSLQWRFNGVDLADGPTGNGDVISGSTSSTLNVANAQYPASQGAYSLVASNVAGIVTNSATLTVIVPPVITLQPVSLVVTNTQPASFTAAATGVPTPGYKWLKNGSPITDVGNISGSSTATLSFSAVTPADIGNYSVTITNQAGTTNSVTVSLTVNSLMTPTALSPNNAATGVFYDTPLAITFSQPPTLRAAGTIKIFNVTDPVTPVDTIFLSLGNPQQRGFPGDGQSFTYFAVTISGNTATIYPHSSVMTSNQTYYVTVDNGVFTDATGAYFAGITDTNAWKFTTKPGGAVNPTSLVVAANGTGDFLTVQGAVNSIASGNTTPTVINIRNGDYNELVDIAARHNVTFRGQSRGGVVVGYANNATFQSANAGTTHARMAFKINANDIAIENMTVTNRTPVGGSQAEALMIETGARRFIMNNATVSSFQDTILANQNSSEGYFYNSTVQGQFDYIWGGGRLFFTNCEIKTLVGAGGALNTGNVTASRTDLSGTNGFSFMRCQFTRIIPTITNTTLAGANGTAGGNAAFISCNFSDNYTNPSASVISSQILWEFGNSNADNTLPRTFGLTVLTEGDGRLTAARTASIWLNGWTPQLAPNILSHPTNLTVNANASAAFNVVATGISDPTYQWLKDGTNLVGQTGATLTIPNANGYDIGSYSVIVSNAAGTVTSSAATLTVNQPTVGPSLAAATVLGNGNAQFSISGPAGSAGFSYRVWATADLTLTPVTSTWTLLTNDVFGFSPTVFTDTDASGLPQRFYMITVP